MTGLSFHNPQIQRLRRLAGRRSARRDEGCFVIEGATLVAEALAAGIEIETVFVEPGGRHDFAAPVAEVARGVIERVASTVTPQPVLAVARLPRARPDALAGATLVVVLVDVADPGNVGTLARTADAAGADALVLAGAAADPWNPKSVRASAGALFRVPVVEFPTAGEGLVAVHRAGLRRVATSAHAERLCWDADLRGPVALVLGSEAHGLDPAVAVDEWVRIPMRRGESLNVAAAGAVLCYEAVRQRHPAR